MLSLFLCFPSPHPTFPVPMESACVMPGIGALSPGLAHVWCTLPAIYLNTDSFRRSERGWQRKNGATEHTEATRLFHSFRRSDGNAGNTDSFRRSERGWQRKNGSTEHTEATRLFHSFRRSDGNAGNTDSFRRSEKGMAKEKRCYRACRGNAAIPLLPKE